MTVLVVGGTNAVGAAVIKVLSDRGMKARCMTRFANKLKTLPAGVEGCVGNLEKPFSLGIGFDGVSQVFLMTPLHPDETALGLAAVEAAKAAGVNKLVYMSAVMPPDVRHIPHYESKRPIEQAIRQAGFAYTILRPNNFFQNDSMWCRAAVMSYGVYPQPIGSVGLSRVDIRDVAEAAVNALTESVHDGADYSLHGPDVLTGEAVAAIFSKQLGREVRYAGNDLEEWSKQAQHMMPEWMVWRLRSMYEHFQHYGSIAKPADLKFQYKLLKREPLSFNTFVAEVVPVWRREIGSGGLE